MPCSACAKEQRGLKGYYQGSRWVWMWKNSALFFSFWKGKGEIGSMLLGHPCALDTVSTLFFCLLCQHYLIWNVYKNLSVSIHLPKEMMQIIFYIYSYESKRDFARAKLKLLWRINFLEIVKNLRNCSIKDKMIFSLLYSLK